MRRSDRRGRGGFRGLEGEVRPWRSRRIGRSIGPCAGDFSCFDGGGRSGTSRPQKKLIKEGLSFPPPTPPLSHLKLSVLSLKAFRNVSLGRRITSV